MRTLPDSYYHRDIDGKLIPHSVNPGPMLICDDCGHSRFGSDFRVTPDGIRCRYCADSKPRGSKMLATVSSVLVAMLLSSAASAAPRKAAAKARKAAEERFVLACVDERTGPTGGISTDDAYELCRGIVKHSRRIDKLAKRASDARSAGAAPRLVKRLEWECAEEVSIACEDTTVRSTDGGECSDATLEAKHAFDVCRGKAPVAQRSK